MFKRTNAPVPPSFSRTPLLLVGLPCSFSLSLVFIQLRKGERGLAPRDLEVFSDFFPSFWDICLRLFFPF